MENFLAFMTEKATNIGLAIIYAALVLFFGLKLSKWASSKIVKLRVFDKIEPSVCHFIASLLKVVLYALVIISAAIILGIPTTTFITILGSAALAIGLALQGSLSNLAGSIMILVFKPFKVGDFIEYGSLKGTVEDINIFYTVLRTPDNKAITCPNGPLSNKEIINYSANDTRRIDLTFTAGYDSDIDEVKSILLKCAELDDRILANPAPAALFTKQGESALEFTLRVWCENKNYWDVYFMLMENVKKAFNAAGIDIPFKQVDVHVKR